MIIFLSISLSMCFGCSKEPSHREGSFEYPQHMFWLSNKKNNFQLGACWSQVRTSNSGCFSVDEKYFQPSPQCRPWSGITYLLQKSYIFDFILKALVFYSILTYRVNVGTFGHSRVQLFLGTWHVVQCNISNDIYMLILFKICFKTILSRKHNKNVDKSSLLCLWSDSWYNRTIAGTFGHTGWYNRTTKKVTHLGVESVDKRLFISCYSFILQQNTKLRP